VLVQTKDPLTVAALIDELMTNSALHDRVLRNQDAALTRLLARGFDRTLLRFVEQVRHSPRLPHPPIAEDFWEQVAFADRLAQIRLHRPGAFMAVADAKNAEQDQ
jgi:hypothetical protein